MKFAEPLRCWEGRDSASGMAPVGEGVLLLTHALSH